MGKRKEQSEARRNQIFKCALDMFVSRGYEATKIRDIAARLNISVGLCFNYFESKEKLYEELIRFGISGPSHVFALDREGKTPLMILKDMIYLIFESIRCESLTAKMFLLMAQAMRNEANPESVKALLTGFDAITPMVQLVMEGQRLGEIRDGDPLALTIAFWGAIQGIAEYVAMSPQLPLPESSWIIDMLKKQSS